MGSETLPTLLFIHGLSATAESCYGTVGRLLQNNWHIVLCELDGHYEESPPFTSIDAECEQIEDYFRKKHNGKIHGMIGLSLGGTIAVSILSRGRIRIEKTVLDAAFCVDMGLLKGCYTWLFPIGVARVRDGKYVPGFLIDLLMGRENRSMTQMIYPGISVETCRNACRDVYSYRIYDKLRNTSSKVEFWRGSREPYPDGLYKCADYFWTIERPDHVDACQRFPARFHEWPDERKHDHLVRNYDDPGNNDKEMRRHETGT